MYTTTGAGIKGTDTHKTYLILNDALQDYFRAHVIQSR